MAQEGLFFKSLLGDMGIIDQEREAIEYRERPPLVVPPKMELRQPVDSASVALRNPAWPKDPDVAAKKKAAADARKPVNSSDNSVLQGGRLTPEQIRAGRKIDGGQGDDPNAPRRTYGDNSKEAILVSPDQLRAGAKSNKAEPTLAYGVEPPRTDLIQPPPGYRLPAGNGPLKTTQEPPAPREDEANPIGFIRQQRQN
jgi:hypothetical protein